MSVPGRSWDVGSTTFFVESHYIVTSLADVTKHVFVKDLGTLPSGKLT